jgi:4-methoxybenzoate monooxygenase (O-demethylating)
MADYRHSLQDPIAFGVALRAAAPSPFSGRITTTPLEIDGVQIGAEKKVIMFVAAANRDARYWDRSGLMNAHHESNWGDLT